MFFEFQNQSALHVIVTTFTETDFVHIFVKGD